MEVAGYDETTYGDSIADIYDSLSQIPKDTTDAVALLADLAHGGRVLELGIGTGRLALPLRERGLTIEGVDASAAMVAKMRAKPGGHEIPVTIGSFADVALEGRFSLVFVAFNTFFDLPTQEAQLRCFANVAAYLEPEGGFVIEAIVPDLGRYDRGQRVQAADVDAESAGIYVALHNIAEQRVVSQHIVFTNAGIRLYPLQLRYCWPSELDLMARLAGLQLASRWGGWRKEPFTSASGNHVSLYKRPALSGVDS